MLSRLLLCRFSSLWKKASKIVCRMWRNHKVRYFFYSSPFSEAFGRTGSVDWLIATPVTIVRGGTGSTWPKVV